MSCVLLSLSFLDWNESRERAWDVVFLHEGNLLMRVSLKDQASMLREPVDERKGCAIFCVVLFESVSHFPQ